MCSSCSGCWRNPSCFSSPAGLLFAGTTFALKRLFEWKPDYSSSLREAGSLQDVLDDPSGELFYFSGTHLYIKMTDPGQGARMPMQVMLKERVLDVNAHRRRFHTGQHKETANYSRDNPDPSVHRRLQSHPTPHRWWHCLGHKVGA